MVQNRNGRRPGEVITTQDKLVSINREIKKLDERVTNLEECCDKLDEELVTECIIVDDIHVNGKTYTGDIESEGTHCACCFVGNCAIVTDAEICNVKSENICAECAHFTTATIDNLNFTCTEVDNLKVNCHLQVDGTSCFECKIDGSITNADVAETISTNPIIHCREGGEGAGDYICVQVGDKCSEEMQLVHAACSYTSDTATNLASNPQLSVGSVCADNITVTAGNKTSQEFTVPYATNSSNATNADTATNLKDAPVLAECGTCIYVTAGGKDSNCLEPKYAKCSCRILISCGASNGAFPLLMDSQTGSASGYRSLYKDCGNNLTFNPSTDVLSVPKISATCCVNTECLCATCKVDTNEVNATNVNATALCATSNVNIDGNTVIGGDLTVNGTMTTIHAQDVSTCQDVITLRECATSSIGGNCYSGLKITKYDGNCDLIVGVDNEGTLKVGTSPSDMEAFATRDEAACMENNYAAHWDSTNKLIKTNGTTCTHSLCINGNATSTGNITANSFTGSLTGNADTATKLAATKNINGTAFDGSSDITTTKWGTARNVSISDSDGTNTSSAVSVDGSANATLKLPSTIKATLTGNADTSCCVCISPTVCNGICYVTFSANNTSGKKQIYTNASLTYNPSTGTLATTKFCGSLAGCADDSGKFAGKNETCWCNIIKSTCVNNAAHATTADSATCAGSASCSATVHSIATHVDGTCHIALFDGCTSVSNARLYVADTYPLTYNPSQGVLGVQKVCQCIDSFNNCLCLAGSTIKYAKITLDAYRYSAQEQSELLRIQMYNTCAEISIREMSNDPSAGNAPVINYYCRLGSYGLNCVALASDVKNAIWLKYGGWRTANIQSSLPIKSIEYTSTAPANVTWIDATDANSSCIFTSSTNAEYPLVFSTCCATPTAGNRTLYNDSANNLMYNPSTNTLTAACFCGTASCAVNATNATNATCFNGCTYAQACANIRSGLTSCTGTVTSVNVSVNGVSGTAVTSSGTVTLTGVKGAGTCVYNAYCIDWFCGSADRPLVLANAPAPNLVPYTTSLGVTTCSCPQLTYNPSNGVLKAKTVLSTSFQNAPVTLGYTPANANPVWINVGYIKPDNTVNSSQSLELHAGGRGMVDSATIDIHLASSEGPTWTIRHPTRYTGGSGLSCLCLTRTGNAWCDNVTLWALVTPFRANDSFTVNLYKKNVSNWVDCMSVVSGNPTGIGILSSSVENNINVFTGTVCASCFCGTASCAVNATNAVGFCRYATGSNSAYHLALLAGCGTTSGANAYVSSACPLTFNPATGVLTARCFCGAVSGTGTIENANCFNGCTYAQAKADIRYGLTSCTGTVTISDSNANSSIPVALCTGSTSVGRSTGNALCYNPFTGSLCSRQFKSTTSVITISNACGDATAEKDGSIAIGNGAYANHYCSNRSSIAIGKCACACFSADLAAFCTSPIAIGNCACATNKGQVATNVAIGDNPSCDNCIWGKGSIYTISWPSNALICDLWKALEEKGLTLNDNNSYIGVIGHSTFTEYYGRKVSPTALSYANCTFTMIGGPQFNGAIDVYTTMLTITKTCTAQAGFAGSMMIVW